MHLPVALLSVLLQRAPLLRTAVTAELTWSSTIGALLRGAFAATAMGGYHALAGATQLQTTPTSPVSGTVGQPFTVVFAVTGAPAPAASYEIRGALPPGLSIPGLTGDRLNGNAGSLSGTPTAAGTYQLNLRAWAGINKSGQGGNPTFPLTIVIGGTVLTAPTFTTHPANVSVVAGQNATFTATAAASGTIAYQWSKDGVTLSGATSSTLIVPSTTAASAGVYRVSATNTAGTTVSQPATLTVTAPPVAPAIVRSPTGQTIAIGGTVAFEVAATGPQLTYQWYRDNQAIPDAAAPLLLLRNVGAGQGGVYTVAVTNSAGAIVSAGATLSLVSSVSTGRLVNLSVRSFAGAGAQTLIAGFTIAGTNNANLVIRGIGPTLGVFGVPSVLADPRLDVINAATGVLVGSNDNWVGVDGQSVGGFALPLGSKDAVLATSLPAGGYTAQVIASGGGAGEALAEVYEAAGGGAELINLSARTQLESGRTLIGGLSIGGTTSRTILIRAVGPGLDVFGVAGTLANPRLELYAGSIKLSENDDWGGGLVLADTSASVGAFPLGSGTSKDSVLLVTLPPGGYTANVSGIGGTGGVVLVEIYLLP